MQNKYALAVEIDRDIYEIFDMFFFEPNTPMSERYKKSVSEGAIAILAPDYNNIEIGATLVDNKFIFDSKEDTEKFQEDDAVFVLLSKNKIFGIIKMKKNAPSFPKYDAAFENNVIVLDVCTEESVGFGDIWDADKKIMLKYENG